MKIHQLYGDVNGKWMEINGDVNGCVHGNVNPLKQCQSISMLNGDVKRC